MATKSAAGGEAEIARRQAGYIRESERLLAVPIEAERRAVAAQAAHERAADKSLRPGSPEWRQKVGRASR